jgi:predicted metal-dependent peptidase
VDHVTDSEARDRIIHARVRLLLAHPFFGNIATRLTITNADTWCSTAATDGRKLYYNSSFIMSLSHEEIIFLVAHETLHLVYDHLDRKEFRNFKLWNIASDYAINADLIHHNIGKFITFGLYDKAYHEKPSEEIYDKLVSNISQIDIDSLTDRLLDDHLENGDEEHEGADENGSKPGPAKLSSEERAKIRQEIKEAIIAAAAMAEPGTLPKGVERLINQLTSPVMPWRDLLQTSITSMIKSDYSWMRPSRRSWHMDAVMPGMKPNEEIDIFVMIDMSGSISNEQGMQFLSEVIGMMQAFDRYKIRVACFDTQVYNTQEFNSDNMDTVEDYKLMGGGGTDFTCIFDHLKEEGRVPN